MIYPIVRMYATAERAAVAVSRLKAWRFGSDDITVIAPSAGATPDVIRGALLRALVPASQAAPYVQGVLAGQVVVVVQAPLGTGGMATDFLESAGPVDSGLQLQFDRAPTWDEGAPLSSALRLRVLTARGDSPHLTPCLLTKDGTTTCSALGIPELQESGAPTTEGLGLPLLSDSPAPFSALLHLPTLI